MYLKRLNKEEQVMLLELLYKISVCDRELSDQEEELLELYKRELGISEIKDENPVEFLLTFFSSSLKETKKIVWFEIVNMVLADEFIRDEEQHIVDLASERLGLSKEELKNIEIAVIDLHKAYNRVYGLLLEE